jgi:hypothetical protein
VEEISEARAQIIADEHAVAVAQDRLQAADSALAFARATQSRYASLNNSGFMPRHRLDRVTNDLHGANDALAAAQAAVAQAGSVKAMHEAALALAEAELGTAQWHLSRTQVISPTDGRINNLKVRVGDTATVYIPIIGILDAHAWRRVAEGAVGSAVALVIAYMLAPEGRPRPAGPRLVPDLGPGLAEAPACAALRPQSAQTMRLTVAAMTWVLPAG